MKVLDLFSGVGGFSIAAHWMGWETVAFVEWDKYCQKVLKKNFPGIPIYGDIKEFDGTKYRGKVDIAVGGFPCQPFSHAGKRDGEQDDRYLWPEMLRVISEVHPSWTVIENVSGLISMEDGDTLERILTDLEGEGYEVQPCIIPACGVGAWHRRDRVWIIAYADRDGFGRESGEVQKEEGEEPVQQQYCMAEFGKSGEIRGIFNNTTGGRQEKQRGCPQENITIQDAQWTDWWEAQRRFRRVPDGISTGMDPNRSARLKALGNAVVPQVVYEIFKAIENYDHHQTLQNSPPGEKGVA